MHTSLLLLATLAPGADPENGASEAPKWQASYTQARSASRDRDKPLAVFVGSGPDGWKKVADGGLSAEARKLLADNYVCYYADASRPEGRRLADALEMSNGSGVVLSTRDGESQAFWHDGSISRGELERRLRRYSNGSAPTSTETLARASYAYDPTSVAGRAGATLGSVMTAPSSVLPYGAGFYGSVPTYHGGHGGYSMHGGYRGGCAGGCRGGRCR
jgi:hypothetical protein